MNQPRKQHCKNAQLLYINWSRSSLPPQLFYCFWCLENCSYHIYLSLRLLSETLPRICLHVSTESIRRSVGEMHRGGCSTSPMSPSSPQVSPSSPMPSSIPPSLSDPLEDLVIISCGSNIEVSNAHRGWHLNTGHCGVVTNSALSLWDQTMPLPEHQDDQQPPDTADKQVQSWGFPRC